MKGDADVLRSASVAIVGSRAASPYALEVARQLGADLARRSVTVVSGLARGVDSAAHRGALEGGGRTIAVFGCGVDVIYPPEHRGLAERIARTWRARERVSSGHASLQTPLSAAQSHHQRSVTGRRHRRGGRRQRLADHRRFRARTGTCGAGGARQRAGRAELRAPMRSCAMVQSLWSVRTISWRSSRWGLGTWDQGLAVQKNPGRRIPRLRIQFSGRWTMAMLTISTRSRSDRESIG